MVVDDNTKIKLYEALINKCELNLLIITVEKCINIVYTIDKEIARSVNMKNSLGIHKIGRIKKWGNGTGILLPRAILDMLSIKTDDAVEISVTDQSIIISPVKKKHLTLAERFASYEGETKQEEYWNDNPAGKEIF